MKPEEALKELSYDDTAYGGKCTYQVRMTAIDALEKQIPKEPKYKKQLRDFFGGGNRSQRWLPLMQKSRDLFDCKLLS